MQKNLFESNFYAVFGTGRGLDVLGLEFGSLGVAEGVVYVLNANFGRQFRGNGEYVTDHGRGRPLIFDRVEGRCFLSTKLIQSFSIVAMRVRHRFAQSCRS